MNSLLHREGAIKILYVAALLFASVVTATVAQDTNDLPTTVTIDGHTYSNVTWGVVTPATVSITYATGTTTVPLENLPPELRSRFGYDKAKAKEYQGTQTVADMHQVEQDRLHTLRGLDLRLIGNKLYDFSPLRQLIAQKVECNRKLAGTAGQPGFEDQLNRMLQIDALLGRASEYCVMGYVSTIRSDTLTVTDNLLGDYVDVIHFPRPRGLVSGSEITIPALWVSDQGDSRVYDYGTVPTDDQLLNLPVKRVEVK